MQLPILTLLVGLLAGVAIGALMVDVLLVQPLQRQIRRNRIRLLKAHMAMIPPPTPRVIHHRGTPYLEGNEHWSKRAELREVAP